MKTLEEKLQEHQITIKVIWEDMVKSFAKDEDEVNQINTHFKSIFNVLIDIRNREANGILESSNNEATNI